jgi:hypothetical protein
LIGGTHFALDGVKLPSNAAEEWSGTFVDLRQKQLRLEEKVKRVLAQHERADKEEEESSAAAGRTEQQKRQDQLQRLEQQAARIGGFLAATEPNRASRAKSCRVMS